MSQEELDPSKSIYLANEANEFEPFSTEELLASRLNQFKGWRCAAGSENIHITSDGFIVLAACQVNGYHGNAYMGQFDLPSEWVVCDQEACMCGGDMQIRKARDLNFKLSSLAELPKNRVAGIKDIRWSAPYHIEAHRRHPKTVSWDMGKRCNYKCSYCHPLVSNQTDPKLSWEQIKFTTDQVIDRFGRGDGIKWVITGGEPTIIPSYMDWVKYVRELGHIVHTTTNGSRGPEYLSELIKYSCIGWSLHLEYLNETRLVQSVESIIEMKKQNEEASWWWFGIRIMAPPGLVSKAIRVRNLLNEVEELPKYCQVLLSPTHKYNSEGVELFFGELEDYNPEELELLRNYT